MEKFKVKKKHLTGEIADFPKRVVQAMCDEQVRQGNPFSPAVFQSHREADLTHGGFNWIQSELGQETWDAIIFKRAFHRMPAAAQPSAEATPHEIIQHMLDKGMAVWACVSDKSYDDARANIGRHAYRVTRYCTDSCYPVLTWYTSRKYAIPIDTATMTEITGVPK